MEGLAGIVCSVLTLLIPSQKISSTFYEYDSETISFCNE
ncbi:hypothetical protein BH10BAC3_BH10BAC3_03990 [soil metagenome]